MPGFVFLFKKKNDSYGTFHSRNIKFNLNPMQHKLKYWSHFYFGIWKKYLVKNLT